MPPRTRQARTAPASQAAQSVPAATFALEVSGSVRVQGTHVTVNQYDAALYEKLARLAVGLDDWEYGHPIVVRLTVDDEFDPELAWQQAADEAQI